MAVFECPLFSRFWELSGHNQFMSTRPSETATRCCLLLLDPLIEVLALKPPLAAHLERGQLALLSHGVDGLFRDLQQLGDSGSVRISFGMNRPSPL